MFRETILTLSEFFFWILGGVPLMNTLWILPYVVVMSLIMALPFILLTYGKNRPINVLPLFLISFFPVLLVGMGPPIIQIQMLEECEMVEQVISTDMVENHNMSIKQCRIKDNYYGEFGEWAIYGDGR
jgi:hypothetical protein